MAELKYFTVREDYYENDENGKPKLIAAAGSKIPWNAAKAYGLVTKEDEPEAAPVLPFEPGTPRKAKA